MNTPRSNKQSVWKMKVRIFHRIQTFFIHNLAIFIRIPKVTGYISSIVSAKKSTERKLTKKEKLKKKMFATALVWNFGFSFDCTCAKFVLKPHNPHTLIIENIFEFINVRSGAKERLWKMLHRISQKCGKCWIFTCSAKVLLNYFKISVSKLFTWPLFFFLYFWTT